MKVSFTIVSFRENLRRAFNDADQGHEVIIERYGQKYRLSALVGEPNEDGSFKGAVPDTKEFDGSDIPPTINDPRVNEVIVEETKQLCKRNREPGFCPNMECRNNPNKMRESNNG